MVDVDKATQDKEQRKMEKGLEVLKNDRNRFRMIRKQWEKKKKRGGERKKRRGRDG